MKKVMFIEMVCALLAVSVFASPTVKLYQSGYSYGNGGEFSALPGNWGWDPLKGYNSKTSGVYKGTFQTFCIEYTEEYVPGQTYDVTFSNKAIEGGVGPAGDPISKGTAYLYQQFATGNLAGYHYTGSLRDNDAGVLQKAFWYLEQEQNGALNSTYTTLLVNKFGSVANAMQDNDGQYPVGVINLWQSGHAGDLNYRAQDQLVCVPAVPAPAAVLLGSIGVCFVGWLRKRNKL